MEGCLGCGLIDGGFTEWVVCYTVGHYLDQIVRTAFVGKTRIVTDQITGRRLQFVRDTPRQRPRCDASRLGAADKTMGSALEVEANLGQLRGLARPSFAR